MKILLDDEISGGPPAFAEFGDVQTFVGRDLGPADLDDADILLIRSVTRVDETLLGGSNIRFVGTSTAGIDHVDMNWLEANGIEFASAPGCNAEAVAEHVICCLFSYAAEIGRRPRSLRVGIVGYGHVGKSLAGKLSGLGIEHLINDPPLAEREPDLPSRSLEEIVQCDVITLHVPLTTEGDHPTSRLFGTREFAALRPRALLINAARGGIVDEVALSRHANHDPDFRAAVDCWQGEPLVNLDTLAQAWRASPHVAGHTFGARANATAMLRQALGSYVGRKPGDYQQDAQKQLIAVRPGFSETAGLLEQIQPLINHTEVMRTWSSGDFDARRQAFDRYRRTHGLRRGFAASAVAPAGLQQDTVEDLKALGIQIVGDG